MQPGQEQSHPLLQQAHGHSDVPQGQAVAGVHGQPCSDLQAQASTHRLGQHPPPSCWQVHSAPQVHPPSDWQHDLSQWQSMSRSLKKGAKETGKCSMLADSYVTDSCVRIADFEVRGGLYVLSTRRCAGSEFSLKRGLARYHTEACPCTHSRYQEIRMTLSTWTADESASVSNERCNTKITPWCELVVQRAEQAAL